VVVVGDGHGCSGGITGLKENTMIDLPPQMWWYIAAVTIPMAGLSGYRLWAIDRREREQRLRLDAFRGPIQAAAAIAVVPWYQQFGSWFSPLLGVVEQQRLVKLLTQAGIKGHTSLASFIAMKVLTALMFAAVAWLVLEWRHLFVSSMLIRIAILAIGLIIGWRLPDIILHRLVARRRLRLDHGMPDALVLLVICAESGLSLNQSIEEISRQLRLSNKDVADEFAATSAEMQLTPDFGKALDNMVERTGLEHLGGLVATLKQSMKFGTPLAEAVRIIAGEMRAERQSRIEERAARLPVLLAIPMMMFILPCLMMIIGTPVALRMMDTVKNLTIGGLR
jgi:tight adherence protein C